MTVTGRTVRILLTGALGGAMGANIANGLTIAEDGRAAAVVVVHHDAGPAVRYAAEELSALLEKVIGAKCANRVGICRRPPPQRQDEC